MKKVKFWLFGILMLVFSGLRAQGLPENWYNLDLEKDGIFGVSTERAYELLKNRTAKTVVVAVIDAGTEVLHEDLKDIIWVNSKEIAGNGVDDDKNGYVDDIHGWNFIGGKDSTFVTEDNFELTRLYVKLHNKYKNFDAKSVSKADKKEYNEYLNIKKSYEEQLMQFTTTNNAYSSLVNSIEKIQKETGKTQPEVSDLDDFVYESMWDSLAVVSLRSYLKKGGSVDLMINSLTGAMEYSEKMVKYYLNPDFNPRSIVGDNYEDASEKAYGNPYVFGPHADHGTHVAGIIAAVRNNGIGVNGVAENVKIMVLRVVPDGDERDKDVANAIRYAVDNGASIINMSFGKAYSYNKLAVDEAVRYAMEKDVLMVHGAGNDGKNIDVERNYPNQYFENGKQATGWIEVGATTHTNNQALPAVFSNYGSKTVDVFAPGNDINNCVPESSYQVNSGTSMAAPVVAGVAAILRAYFPTLTAVQIEQILVETSTPVKNTVIQPGTEDKKTKMSKLCRSGGVVNAYSAVQKAIQITDGAAK